MKFFKKLGIFLLVVIFLLLFVIAFAFEARSYQCSGELSTERGVQNTTATMEIQFYRDGIRIFSASDGSITFHIDSMEEIQNEVATWEKHRNNEDSKINWRFTNDQARIKLKKLYPSFHE